MFFFIPIASSPLLALMLPDKEGAQGLILLAVVRKGTVLKNGEWQHIFA
jgi:hypothetical protein